MAYESEHASALADLAAAGVEVTFTETKPGTSDPETGLFTSPTESTVVCQAIQIGGDPETYQRLKLTPEEAVTLLCGPNTKGQKAALGSTVPFPPTGGDTYTVKSVQSLAPDGSVITSTVVIAR